MSKPTNNSPSEANEPTSAAESGRTTNEIALARVLWARGGGDVATLPYPPRAAGGLTEAQRDGVACVLCGCQTGAMIPVGILSGGDQVFACVSCPDQSPVAPTSSSWPDGEPETVRDAARLNDLIERIAELAGQMFTLKFGQEAGAVGERLTRFIVCDAASDCRLDPDEVTALFMALKRGDLATVEEFLR